MRQDVDRGFFLALMGAIGMYLLFFASYVCWDGAWCWGPRVIIITVPLMLLPLAAVFSRLGQWKKWARGAVAFVLALSLMVQALPIGSNFYLSMIRKYKPITDLEGREIVTKTFGALQSDERYRAFFEWEYASVPNQAKDFLRVFKQQLDSSYDLRAAQKEEGLYNAIYYADYYRVDLWWVQVGGLWRYPTVAVLICVALWSACYVYARART